jgi:hypothetical protein
MMAGLLHRLWYGPDPSPPGLTAAGTSLRVGVDRVLPRYEHWQQEVWALYDELGEFYYGVRWLAEMVSRVRLVAATPPESPGDEPSLVETEGTPRELVEQFGGGAGGAAQLQKRLTVQLSVPGEGWLVVEDTRETDGVGGQRWSVRSAEEVRRSSRRGRRTAAAPVRTRGGTLTSGAYGVEVVDEDQPPGDQVRWRLLADDTLIVRVWNPHDRWYTRADSSAQHARQAMRELQLANRYIQATFLSRLATAGVFLLPSEASFPVRPEFEQFEDAFEREWLATAAEAVRTPGTASAVVPILMRLNADMLDKVKHIDFTTAFDEKILDKRDRAISRVATTLDLPKEVLLGLGDVNHWTAWQLEEGGFRVHVAPVMEQLCNALTTGWYRPVLKEAGEDPNAFLLWYDPSDGITRPDKSERALELYDRGEASGDALRREGGLDDTDKPEGDDLEQWALKQILKKGDPNFVGIAYELLTGEPLNVPGAPGPAGPPPAGGQGPSGGPPAPEPEQAEQAEEGPEAEGTRGERGPPTTQTRPPPPPGGRPPRQPARAGLVPVGVAMPGSPWPVERRTDGWHVWNVNHWLALSPTASAAADQSWLATTPTPALQLDPPPRPVGNGG